MPCSIQASKLRLAGLHHGCSGKPVHSPLPHSQAMFAGVLLQFDASVFLEKPKTSNIMNCNAVLAASQPMSSSGGHRRPGSLCRATHTAGTGRAGVSLGCAVLLTTGGIAIAGQATDSGQGWGSTCSRVPLSRVLRPYVLRSGPGSMFCPAGWRHRLLLPCSAARMQGRGPATPQEMCVAMSSLM